MKKRINKIMARKRAPWGALLLSVGLFFIGCSKETDLTPPVVGPGGEGASVMLTVSTPQPTLPSAFSSRAQTDAESLISDVNVLVFRTGDENVFLYRVPGREIISTGNQQTKFKITLDATSEPLKLLVVSNAKDAFDSLTWTPGTSEGQVRETLEARFTPEGMQGPLPMYGEVSLPDGVSASQTYHFPVTLLRAIARVDVVKELESGSPEFILEEIYAFRTNDRIQLIPDAAHMPSGLKVDAPSLPDGTISLGDPVVRTVSGDTESIVQLYIPESAEAVTNTEKIKSATTLVIGGRFGGAGNPVTYYRADFNSGLPGHPFGQVLRNHRYIFKIKNVSREGWGSPGEAAENLSSSIVVDVQPWEDFSSEMYLGDDRFGISAREISLRYVRNRERSLSVESTYTYSIQWVENGTPAGNAVSDYNVAVSNDDFDAWIIPAPEGGEHVTRLVFRTRKDNHLGEIVSRTLRITAGPWKVDVTVKQDNSALYADRYLNVLTVEGVGDLGVDMVASGASGLAMRKVLDAQFAPQGTIRIGGSSFTRIPNTAGYVGTSASENLAVLKRIFGSQDVIYFPHGVTISSEVADLLLEWVGALPNRVLIVGTDSDSSNKQLRLKGKIAADGGWTFTGLATVSSGYLRAPDSSGTEEFFDGPFGRVAELASFKRADDIAGYMKTPSTTVVPLITADKQGYMGYMFFGVNRTNRIVYHGDAQLFLSGQMSNNSGTVNSDLDKLMANTWAWIVEQVIYGKS